LVFSILASVTKKHFIRAMVKHDFSRWAVLMLGRTLS